jgi:hypothetical protein
MITEEVNVPYIAGSICNGIQFAVVVYGIGAVCVLGLGAGAGGDDSERLCFTGNNGELWIPLRNCAVMYQREACC